MLGETKGNLRESKETLIHKLLVLKCVADMTVALVKQLKQEMEDISVLAYSKMILNMIVIIVISALMKVFRGSSCCCRSSSPDGCFVVHHARLIVRCRC